MTKYPKGLDLYTILQEEYRKSPGESPAGLRAKVREHVTAAHFEELFKNWFKQYYPKVRSEHMENAGRARRAPRTAEERVRARAALAAMVRGRLMDLVLSNGKKLRESTFGDCRRESGWLASIAELGKTNEIVGNHLAEEDLVKLWKRSKR